MILLMVVAGDCTVSQGDQKNRNPRKKERKKEKLRRDLYRKIVMDGMLVEKPLPEDIISE
jgi:hypothetical protein